MGSSIPLPASFTSPMGNIARMHAVNKWLAQGAQLIALMIFGAYLFFWRREKTCPLAHEHVPCGVVGAATHAP